MCCISLNIHFLYHFWNIYKIFIKEIPRYLLFILLVWNTVLISVWHVKAVQDDISAKIDPLIDRVFKDVLQRSHFYIIIWLNPNVHCKSQDYVLIHECDVYAIQDDITIISRDYFLWNTLYKKDVCKIPINNHLCLAQIRGEMYLEADPIVLLVIVQAWRNWAFVNPEAHQNH